MTTKETSSFFITSSIQIKVERHFKDRDGGEIHGT